jgi:hypothetical protein
LGFTPSPRAEFSRRSFVKALGLSVPLAGWPDVHATPLAVNPATINHQLSIGPKELRADVVIIGGGLGGCAAALAAARNGLQVILTEQTDWIGGQLTAQAVPPDENPWIETFGGTRSYLDLRRRIRDYYLRNFPLTAAARAQPWLNPGNGWVSRLCHEPRVSVAVLHELFAPYVAGQRVTIMTRHWAVEATTGSDKLDAITVLSLESGNKVVLRAPLIIDATETGELLPLTKTEFVTGAESQRQTGEPHAPGEAAPANMQAFTYCFAIDYLDGEDHTIDKPRGYAFWRDFVPALKPAWPGRLLSWEYTDPITAKPKQVETDPAKALGLWAYRRIADKSLFLPGTYPGDISLVNWPQNDYLLGNPFDPAGAASSSALSGLGLKQEHLAHAKQLSLSLLYWLQTEAPRPDGGTGWKGLRLRRDIVGTEDGLAKYPYIRESRRLQAEFTVVEQHVGTDARVKETAAAQQDVKAAEFKDSVGIGSYRIDLHPSTGGDNYLDISSLPFQIPLGALIPKRVENLLAGCKNLGVTHITNGCYRLHPVEWNIGEAAGILAAFCVGKKRLPREVRNSPELLHAFQNLLGDQGVPIAWPKVTPR